MEQQETPAKLLSLETEDRQGKQLLPGFTWKYHLQPLLGLEKSWEAGEQSERNTHTDPFGKASPPRGG